MVFSQNIFQFQPILDGKILKIRPMIESDFEEMFLAASDPLIWEQHPNPNRYKKEVFQEYFNDGLKSGGALTVIDKSNGKIVGCSRYYDLCDKMVSIVIGYTFLARSHWGGKYNSELKNLMINHAFRFVDKIIFHVGKSNLRSQKAVLKIGAQFVGEESRDVPNGLSQKKLIYELMKNQLRLTEVGLEHADLIQEIFEASPIYFVRVSGNSPAFDEAIQAIQSGPPKKDHENKKVSFLIYQSDKPIGYIDLLIN